MKYFARGERYKRVIFFLTKRKYNNNMIGYVQCEKYGVDSFQILCHAYCVQSRTYS